MTKIREKLRDDESISENIKPFRKIFLGNIVGVVLFPRGDTDNHVTFAIISEDDGYWFPYAYGSSSYWLDDYITVLKAVKNWCEKNCAKDKDGCGWEFKGESHD